MPILASYKDNTNLSVKLSTKMDMSQAPFLSAYLGVSVVLNPLVIGGELTITNKSLPHYLPNGGEISERVHNEGLVGLGSSHERLDCEA